MTNNMLYAALSYAELGYPVFPCAPGRKEPITEHGHRDATVDIGQIERWWTNQPNANLAIVTAGLLVLDLDAGNSWLANDPDKLVELAIAPLSLTGNGGRQYIFRQPSGKAWRNTTGRLAPNVDTRADGGYIVVPPSVLAGGKAYRWAEGMALDDPPEKLPEPPGWLIEELDRLANGAPTSPRDTAGEVASNPIPTGQRNATLARLAGTMRRVGMSQSEIVAALHRANADRCVPPLSSDEVERIGASVARYAPDEVSVALVENHWDQDFQPQPESHQPVDPEPLPTELLRIPGFVSEVMDYCLATAPYPNEVMAFCGALALQSFLAGRKVRDTGDNRTNLYLLGLAHSVARRSICPRSSGRYMTFWPRIPRSWPAMMTR